MQCSEAMVTPKSGRDMHMCDSDIVLAGHLSLQLAAGCLCCCSHMPWAPARTRVCCHLHRSACSDVGVDIERVHPTLVCVLL